MSAKQLNPAYDGMTDQQVKRFKYWEFRTMAMCIFGYALFYFVRKNLSIAMPYLNEEMGISKSDLGLFLTLHGLIYGLSKFFNGIWGDRSNARYFLVTGLVFCGICNLLFGFSSSVLALGIFWVLNGWFQGMGWPPCGRVMTHWFSQNERGTKMSVWNVAHNVGGGMIGPMAAYGLLWFGSWQIGTFWFPAVVAIVVAMLAFLLIRDTPQSTGLPPIEKYRNDYPKNYSEKSEQELTTKEIFFKYVLNNKILWYIAFANAFVYLVRYGVLDWAPTYLKDIKGYDIKDVGWAYSAYEWAAIPGTIICGWLSDKVFKGRRAITTMIYMALVAVFVVIYWKNMDSVLLDNISLIAIGFLIYGPVMLIGVQALDLAPKKAAGTAAGLTGFFGYFFGTAILANIAMGSIVQHLGWDWGFIMLLAACALAFLFISFTYREEQYLVKQRK